MRIRSRVFGWSAALIAGTAVARAQTVEAISVTPGGALSNGHSTLGGISADGRFVSFTSAATNLGVTDANGAVEDVFLRDRTTQTVELISVWNGGAQSAQPAFAGPVSDDGRYVVFRTNDLDPADTDWSSELFLRDRQSGTTTHVSPLNDFFEYSQPSLSGDGQHLLFFGADQGCLTRTVLRDNLTGAVQIGTYDMCNFFGSSQVVTPMLSSDGRYMAYYLSWGDGYNSWQGVFRYDLVGLSVANVTSAGRRVVAISPDGRFVLFTRWGAGTEDVVLWDAQGPLEETVATLASGYVLGFGQFSDDGRYVVFVSDNNSLVSNDTNGVADAFLRDCFGHQTVRVSLSALGAQANGATNAVAIEGSGAAVVFSTFASNLIAGDTNAKSDVLRRTNCFPHYLDGDGDGHGSGAPQAHCVPPPAGWVASSDDCDDSLASVHPGALELCNGLDEDCDNLIDEEIVLVYYFDGDQDGWGDDANSLVTCMPPTGYIATGGDCDDGNPQVHPFAQEVCNGIDDDCEGGIDEDLGATYYADVDGDGYGDAAAPLFTCNPPSGYVLNATDCDDAVASVHPGAADTCNGVDDDCDGTVDEDFDGAGYCTAGTTTHGCVPQISATGSLRASASSGFVVHVANVEGQKNGLVFYGFGAMSAQWAPFSSSVLCVAPPRQRMSASSSGGTVNQCNGQLSIDARAWMAANPGALGQPLNAGQAFYFQGWFRDPPAPKGTNLSRGWSVTACP